MILDIWKGISPNLALLSATEEDTSVVSILFPSLREST